MSKIEKTVPEKGDNSDKLLIEYVQDYAKIETQIVALREKQKAVLNNAKDDGHKKMSIRGAVKDLRMSSEQRQAKLEVELDRKRAVELCKDLPLFRNAA